ncbi:MULTISPECIES: hypothetical protein [Roseateles]|uniref:ElaB/YqjD/DUF883 family membrane-anchored ribosome-binding protein n=1 Tax=Pelomonas aquatica TaxID=431058 RepID=A0ABU1ZB56_9BURK|nr:MULTISPECIES: hypothetical protein [Roseateles]KQY88884.1 hypothetical protein ASD35_15265 [Pelomonas sp. Root1444]MDR7297823.1 ElaB/YqjD/DUF883 family membrane-anchored ribosome-binding protein [Pelomonas aquatica]
MGHSDLYNQAADTSKLALEKVENAARRSIDRLADSVDGMRTQVARVSDRAVGYVHDAPVRSALVAVAAGALVFGLVRLLSSRSSR